MTHNEILGGKLRKKETIPSSYSGKLHYKTENILIKVRVVFRDA